MLERDFASFSISDRDPKMHGEYSFDHQSQRTGESHPSWRKRVREYAQHSSPFRHMG